MTQLLALLLVVLPLGRIAVAQDPEWKADLVSSGDSAYAAFDNKQALDLYMEAFEQDTSFAVHLRLSRTHYDYGLDLLAQSEESLARTHFEQSVEHANYLVDSHPDSAKSHFMLAATLGNIAQFESGQGKADIGRQVEEHSRQAISLDSTWAYPYVSLGIYFRELSRLSWLERTLARVFYGKVPDISENEVLDMLLHAAKIKPNFAFLHHELAMTYLLYEREDEAMEHLSILVSLAPETSQDVRNQENARRLMAEMGSEK